VAAISMYGILTELLLGGGGEGVVGRGGGSIFEVVRQGIWCVSQEMCEVWPAIPVRESSSQLMRYSLDTDINIRYSTYLPHSCQVSRFGPVGTK
jgi:hypothetical protein